MQGNVTRDYTKVSKEQRRAEQLERLRSTLRKSERRRHRAALRLP